MRHQAGVNRRRDETAALQREQTAISFAGCSMATATGLCSSKPIVAIRRAMNSTASASRDR
jgi:hypothetical protein